TLDNRVWSVDALYDTGAMSKYATLTSISESPVVEGLLYTGSDDGLVHVSEDGGQNWRRSALPKVPARSFINDVEASNHDSNSVFVVVDAHKFGDYYPYIFMSNDRGRSWKSISGDLPDDTIVWVIKQDHIDENLLFIGTEYGIYFSPNKGVNWIKLNTGVPTIAFRDIELHQRDHDLVGATFGRGFYVLDDYSSLRDINGVINEKANALFAVRDAWWYVPNEPMQAKGMPSQGTTSFVAENPPFGAVFTYYLNDIPETSKEVRQKSEKTLREKNASIPFPGWENLQLELSEDDPKVLLLVSDENNNPVRWIKGASKKGLHRVNWDLKLAAPNPITLTQPAFKPPWVGDAEGPLAAPGTYKVELFIAHNGTLQTQGEPQEFMVKAVSNTTPGADFKAIAEFQGETRELSRQISSAGRKLGEAANRIRFMKAALLETPKATEKLFKDLNDLNQQLAELRMRLYGDPARQRMNEATSPSIQSRVGQVIYGHWATRQNPTETQKRNIEIARDEFDTFKGDLSIYFNDLEAYEAA
ncbi:MAG: glycosyl hydrolase, partial [Flavobacteriaceae bacterium]|nr:glycosyl hydrolase [Flavobacteriaceae bacterium]